MRDDLCLLCARSPDDPWVLAYEGYDPMTESTREALLTVGNGYLATRGAWIQAQAEGVHYPATYVAGTYNRLDSEVEGLRRTDESLVNLPNWSPLTFRAQEGAWFEPGSHQVLHHHVGLDLRRGVYVRELVVQDGRLRRTRVTEQRLASMSRPHLAALRVTITPENWSGRLHVRSLIDGRVQNANVAAFDALAKQHLAAPSTAADGESAWLVTQTTRSRILVAEATRTTIDQLADQPPERTTVEGPGLVGHEFTVVCHAGRATGIEKVAAIYTSRDRAISDPLTAARDELTAAPGFAALLQAHELEWEQLWRRHSVSFDGDLHGADRRAVNVHMFHVTQTLSRHTADLDVGVPARGLHGEGYRGHVFWDELFVYSLLNQRTPELTRALLLYRFRRLDQARRRAAASGWRGALFPWQSGSDGREETPPWFFNSRSGRWMADNSHRQYHVNHAVAYSIWHYWQITADADFLTAYGAELLIEIARFWASIAEYDARDDRYHIRAVMGPDEFHDGYPERPGEGIDDNAYVNIMTAWTLTRARETYELLGGHHTTELWERLGLTTGEIDEWDHIARRLYVPFLDNGLLSQFAGFGDLAPLDWDAYRKRYDNIGRLDLILEAEDDSTNCYQASKQADVLMLLYLLSAEEITAILEDLGYAFDPTTIPATVEHYLVRTAHGSTLSRVVHAWVLARTDRRASWHLLREALEADLSDTQVGTTREGIHLGAMAGTTDILQRCYTGLEARNDALWLNPLLPDELTTLSFDLRYRGHWITCSIDGDRLLLKAAPSSAPPVTVVIEGQPHPLVAGAQVTFLLPSRPTAAGPTALGTVTESIID